MDKNIKVSVIVPIYNVEEYIERCLNSLVHQTLKEIEVIVVNDGSPDQSQQIIDRFAEVYPCIKKYSKENGGLSDARNFGMEFGKGEYITFIDSDDYVEKDMLEVMYNKAKANGSDIVECNLRHTYEDREDVEIGKIITDSHERIRIGRSVVWNKIYKTEWLKDTKVVFTKGLIYEDVEFYVKLVPYIRQYDYVEDAFVHYVQRSSSLNNKSSETTKDILQILKNIKMYYEKNNFYAEYRDDLEFLFARILLLSSFKRICKIPDSAIRKQILRENYKLLRDVYPNWKKNPYIKDFPGKHGLFIRSINPVTYKIYSYFLAL